MTLAELAHALTPGEFDAIKQAYRQGYDWRACIQRQCVSKDPALVDGIAECLEREVFPKLPQIIRYDDHGQPVPPKGGREVDDPN
jgi:hypothetical protein